MIQVLYRNPIHNLPMAKTVKVQRPTKALPQAVVRSGSALAKVSSVPLTATQWQAYVLPKSDRQTRFGMNSDIFSPGDILLGDHPPDDELDELDASRKYQWDIMTRSRPGFPQGWLQPEDTVFVVTDQMRMMQANARNGFPLRYNHYSWGEAFNRLYQMQGHGLMRIYESVINTKPSVAYLLDFNPVYAQKLVIGHVFAHTDFFKNNIRFQDSNRDIMRVMADNKRAIAKYASDPMILRKSVGKTTPVERFIDDYKTMEWLIDMSKSAPPPLTPYGQATDPSTVAQVDLDMGLSRQKLGLGGLMRDFIVSEDERSKAVDDALTRRENRIKNIPPEPTRDVLGFLIQHSKSLEPWQRDILTRLREESYYFAPQIQTKVMNEGWATWWHTRMGAEGVYKPDEMVPVAKMMAGGEAHDPQGLNPYLVGRTIFHNIYEKAGRGIPIDVPEEELVKRYSIDELMALKKKPIDDELGIKAIQHVRKYEDDMSFLRKYLTEDVARELGLYNYEEVTDFRGNTEEVVTSKDFNAVKSRILQNYDNGGMPIIEVVNGDYRGRSELLLRHVHLFQDLNRNDAKETLKSVYRMWGMPVHLDTFYTAPVDPNLINSLVQSIRNARQYGQGKAYWRGSEKTLQEMEQELHKLQSNKTKVPIRFSTEDGKDVSIRVLNDKGDTTKNFDPKDFVIKADSDWYW